MFIFEGWIKEEKLVRESENEERISVLEVKRREILWRKRFVGVVKWVEMLDLVVRKWFWRD